MPSCAVEKPLGSLGRREVRNNVNLQSSAPLKEAQKPLCLNYEELAVAFCVPVCSVSISLPSTPSFIHPLSLLLWDLHLALYTLEIIKQAIILSPAGPLCSQNPYVSAISMCFKQPPPIY